MLNTHIVKRFIFLLSLIFITLGVKATDEPTAWQAWLNGEAIVLMRHALAPGTGDPAGFQLEDCATQRNLNAQGRTQAKAWGEMLQHHAAGPVAIYSSQWCRCLETAQLFGLGNVQPLAALNSFFAGRGNGQQQTAALITRFSDAKVAQPTVLVSHQVNITALTGIFPASAEAIIIALPLSQPATILATISP
ncbi:histidine phosphatase family protein [Alishewanella tabrizica]|uniref:Phosphoglycerate mutase n=1 Tax=Alishewanella tabrizica TaxID=671278 RepID=A0ABQ2WKI7_9ALTE|nr:histidine phosphatase family protein [Alishewanella tabrizica]GGW61172.1 phosphoglycerate mutase [Alishewanella tabrizica]